MLPTLRPGPSASCAGRYSVGRRVLRTVVAAGLTAGLALPLVAVARPASAAPSGASVQDGAPQAAVQPVEGDCAVRVTLRAGSGPRAVAVTARAVSDAVDGPAPVVAAPGSAAVASASAITTDSDQPTAGQTHTPMPIDSANNASISSGMTTKLDQGMAIMLAKTPYSPARWK